jgi:hypothetical protein
MKRGLDVRKADAALKRAAHKALHGTREERSGRIVSSILQDVKYDPDSRNLDIRFVSGETYRYSNVPAEVYEQFRDSGSKAKFYYTYIRDRYNYRLL